MTHFIEKTQVEMDIHVESCGLGDWHVGQLPDERMRHAALARGIVLCSRAQAFRADFFETFDHIFVADHSVMYELHRWAKTPEHKAKIHLITKYSTAFKDQEVPDPYHNDEGYFELVMDMLEDSCHGLLEYLRKERAES